MKHEDTDMRPTRKSSLGEGAFEEWGNEPTVIGYGMIAMCKEGYASVSVNFADWELSKGAVIIFFPNDYIVVHGRSADFKAEILKFDASLLREASLQLEQTVYSQLKTDRCRTDSEVLTSIISCMFSLLRIYFGQEGCICLDHLVTLQLKAFFAGFYDYLYRNPEQKKTEDGSPRTKELFSRFMRVLENSYRQSRDVAFYADILNISPKYLNTLAQRMTGHNVKSLINHYVVLQIKQSLITEEKSVKELSSDYHFSDFSFFCRYFKQHTGLSPQQFRKSQTAP